MCAWLGSLHKVSHEKTQNVEPFPEKSMRFFISSTKSKRSTGFSAGTKYPLSRHWILLANFKKQFLVLYSLICFWASYYITVSFGNKARKKNDALEFFPLQMFLTAAPKNSVSALTH